LIVRRLQKALVASGVLVLLIGLVATVTMLVVQDRCQHTQTGSYSDEVAQCAQFHTGVDYAYLVLAAGACTILAGVLSAPLIERRRTNALK
jgi:hypothetical protein